MTYILRNVSLGKGTMRQRYEENLRQRFEINTAYISMMCQYGERTVFALQLTPTLKPSARGDGSRRITKDQDHPVDLGKLLGWHGDVEGGNVEIHSNCVISARDTIFRYLNIYL